MSEGEWDNQAPAVKTATHLSLSDSTREIFQTWHLLHVLMAEKRLHPGRLLGLVPIDWCPFPAPTGQI